MLGTSHRRLTKKLVAVKNGIKRWRCDLKKKDSKEYQKLMIQIDDLEVDAEDRALSSPKRTCRQNWKKIWDKKIFVD